jgi:hypothetical protein
MHAYRWQEMKAKWKPRAYQPLVRAAREKRRLPRLLGVTRLRIFFAFATNMNSNRRMGWVMKGPVVLAVFGAVRSQSGRGAG